MIETLAAVLERFLAGQDFSTEKARRLEGEIDDFRTDPLVEDLVDVLASYQPGGGDLLYSRDKLEAEVRWVLSQLRDG